MLFSRAIRTLTSTSTQSPAKSSSRTLQSDVYVTLDMLLQAGKLINGYSSEPAVSNENPGYGSALSKSLGQGHEFSEVRPFQTGDDKRHIDWRVSARYAKLHTRQFHEDRIQPVYIAVDQRCNMFFGSTGKFKSVVAAIHSAQTAWQSYHQRLPLGYSIAGDHLINRSQRSGRAALLEMLNTLAQTNQQLDQFSQPAITLNELLNACLQQPGAQSRLFIISDFHDVDDVTAQLLQLLMNKHQCRFILISDPLESRLRTGRRLACSDGIRTARIGLSKNDSQRYTQRHSERLQHLKSMIDNHGGSWQHVNTTDNITLSPVAKAL